MSIWFDRTARSIIVGCSSCGVRDVFTSQGAADHWAVAHAMAHHVEHERQVLASITRRQHRHAG